MVKNQNEYLSYWKAKRSTIVLKLYTDVHEHVGLALTMPKYSESVNDSFECN